jgi:amino-acid N-acetyltransferase
MSNATIVLRPAEEAGLSSVETLLEANGLPTRDVRSMPECFSVAEANGERVGVGGIERYGADGLLRSVAVEESARGRGFGTAICERLEQRAHASGVETLYLLTTTASEFFADRGYVAVDRREPPDSIRATSEFEELCPATAVCMRKSL